MIDLYGISMNCGMNHCNGSLSFWKKWTKWFCDLEYFGFVVNWLRNHTSAPRELVKPGQYFLLWESCLICISPSSHRTYKYARGGTRCIPSYSRILNLTPRGNDSAGIAIVKVRCRPWTCLPTTQTEVTKVSVRLNEAYPRLKSIR